MHAGEDFYIRAFGGSRNRWGDYSGISVDPTDDTTFWVFNEYAALRGTAISGEDGRWGTAWASCDFDAPPAGPQIFSPTPIDFDLVLVGYTADRPVPINNIGDAPLTVSSISNSGGAPFSIDLSGLSTGGSLPVVIPPLGFETITATFAPTSTGIFGAGSIDIASDDPDDPLIVVGLIGTGTEPIVFRVERSTGDVFALGSFIGGGADLAERINVSESVEPGDVVELDPTKPTYYRKARGGSHLIAGVITTEPGFTLGNNPEKMELGTQTHSRPMLALIGRVPTKVSTENGPIRPGDLLTVASKPGYAKLCAECKRV